MFACPDKNCSFHILGFPATTVCSYTKSRYNYTFIHSHTLIVTWLITLCFTTP